MLAPYLVGLIVLHKTIATMFSNGTPYGSVPGEIKVTESRLTFGELKSDETVAVIGMVKNTTPVPWRSLLFHVDFFDAAGKRVDVGEKTDREILLNINDSKSFKVSFRREFPTNHYSRVEVTVLSASDARGTARFGL